MSTCTRLKTTGVWAHVGWFRDHLTYCYADVPRVWDYLKRVRADVPWFGTI